MLAAALAAFTLLGALSGCTPEAAEPEDTAAPSAKVTQTPEPTFDPGFVIEPPPLSGEAGDESAPPSEPDAASLEGPDVPERERADDEFFEDAAFIGNSLVDGFRMFSGLTTCDYYAATSMTVLGVESAYAVTLDSGASGTIMQGLAQREYGKLYILLGINEIGFEPEYFQGLYRDMLKKMMELQPDAVIYVMGLTPVSYYSSTTSDSFTMDRVRAYNEALYALAEELDCCYLDLCSALAGEDGYLPADVTSDGVHFTAEHYKLWLEYIRTHYI